MCIPHDTQLPALSRAGCSGSGFGAKNGKVLNGYSWRLRVLMPKRCRSDHSDRAPDLQHSAVASSAREEAAPLHVHVDESTLPQEWPFETDFGDHFETPRRAFKDIKPVRPEPTSQIPLTFSTFLLPLPSRSC
jgi:hypothetical protein